MPRKKKQNGEWSETLPNLMMADRRREGVPPSWEEVSRIRKETEGDFSTEARHLRWTVVGGHYRSELPKLGDADRRALMISSIRLALECMQSPRSMESMRQAVRQIGFSLPECRVIGRKFLGQLDFCLSLSDNKSGYQFWLRDRPRESHPASSEEEIVAAIQEVLDHAQGWISQPDLISRLEAKGIVFPKEPNYHSILRWSQSLPQAIGRKDGSLCDIARADLTHAAREVLAESTFPISAGKIWMEVRAKEDLAPHPCHDLHVRYWLERIPDLVTSPMGGYTLEGKNTQPLRIAILTVLKAAEKPLRSSEVWKRVQELGYVTTAKDPIQNVASALVAQPRAKSTPDGYVLLPARPRQGGASD